MPYSNVPKKLWPKMDRCVKDVMADGKTKQQAIGICYSSIVGKKDIEMSDEFEVVDEELPEAEPDFDFDDTLAELEAMESEDYAPQDEEDTVEIEVEPDVEPETEEKPKKSVSRLQDVISEASDILADLIEEEKGAELPVEEDSDDFDFELAQLEIDFRRADEEVGIFDRVKAVLSSGARTSLPDSSFALVVKRDGKKVRKYPIHDKAHVRNALARASQQIKAGGQGASDARAALPKIRAAAKRMGIGMAKKDSLFVTKNANKEQAERFPYRWVGIYSNNYLDRDGEILTEAAHKEFIDYLNREVLNTKDASTAPEFRIWHVKGSQREAVVDAAEFMNGFAVVSGPLTEKEAQGLMRAAAEYELGMSHGFIPLKRDPEHPNLITKYRSYEVSDLPRDHAANSWTNLFAYSKEAGMKNQTFESFLKLQVGDERYQKLLEDTDAQKAIMDAIGIPSKEIETVTDEETPVEEKAEVTTDLEEKYQLKELEPYLEGLVAQVKELSASVDELKAENAALKADKEDILADLIEPPAEKGHKVLWARGKQREEVDEEADAELLKAVPGLKDDEWLSKETGTTPIPFPETEGDALDSVAA